jgi:uncharacterized Zn finger protein (UPF0148 family)
MQHCEHCGEPLPCFEGETFCADCAYWETVEQMELATDEAMAQLAIREPEPDVRNWHGEEPPF